MNEVAQKLQIELSRESKNHLVVDLNQAVILEKHPISEDPRRAGYFVLIHEIQRTTLECVFWDGTNYLRNYNSANFINGGFPVRRNMIDYWCYMNNQRGIESQPDTVPKEFLYCAYCHKHEDVYLEMWWEKDNDEIVICTKSKCQACHKRFGDNGSYRVAHDSVLRPILNRIQNDWPYENTKIDKDVVTAYFGKLELKL